ncbi:MAG: tagaturonate epimerase family protein, partial [Lentisphaeria bacterium]
LFLDSSDFFTLDVADFTGNAAAAEDISAFLAKHSDLINKPIVVEGLADPISVTEEEVRAIAEKFLLAVQEAGKLYRYILSKKGEGNFIAEVSMDETDLPQTPVDMLFILAALADEKIPLQTIAPKFTGRFNKGVDYVGDLAQFAKEFEGDLVVIRYAIKKFGLPENLKLSVHSGSDKFSIYPIINKAIKKFDSGLHLKTAGTTWLEELIGLAAADGDGLQLAKDVYKDAYQRFAELCKPYATVIDIDTDKLPTPEVVAGWTSKKFCDTLRHDQSNADYSLSFRQMLHVAFRVAAEMGSRYIDALEEFEPVIAENVIENIYARHIVPVFIGK